MDLVQLDIDDRGDVVIASVSGELDLAGAPSTGDAIGGAVPTSARALVVDFTGLEFNLARRLGSRRQELHVVAVGGTPVARVLEIVEFDRAAPVHETRDAALAKLS
jgi:anti-anti-sigma regulatory factor